MNKALYFYTILLTMFLGLYVSKANAETIISPTPEQTVVIVGEISSSNPVAEEIILKSQTANALYVIIDSPGGDILYGMKIMNAIESSKVPVYTICLQECASMAFNIHQVGHKRYVMKRSILMAHPGSVEGLSGTFEEILSRIGMIKSLTDSMDKDIAKRSNIPFEQFQIMVLSTLWITGEDAYAKKLADGIVAINFNVPSSFNSSEAPDFEQSSSKLKNTFKNFKR